MLRLRLVLAGAVAFGSACSLEQSAPDPIDVDTAEADRGCPDIYRQDLLPEYHIEISDQEWAALEDEFLHRAEREEMGLDPNPYHPVRFEYEGQEVPGVMLRLKGQSSWWEAIAFDENPKMQFVIAFNEVDKAGRFHGVRRIELDMPRTDASFLRQRLGLYILRRAGVTAQCANNARLYINGDYYGLYTNMERLDKEFLQRWFGFDDDGDLWKGGREIRTNEETFEWDRLERFWYPTGGLAEIDELVDIDASVKVWAAEAVVPHADGYYMGRANYFLYDHPTRGFVWLPHDLDAAIDFIPPDTSPLFPAGEGRNPNDREHWSLILGDQGWLDRYVEYLAAARGTYDPEHLEEAATAFAAQIAAAADEDPMKPFTTADHQWAVDLLRQYPAKRAKSVDQWLDCREQGGPDSDGDGFEWCQDCDDDDPSVHPGAEEVCNDIDDNCDGLIDELGGGEYC
jgi:hypothetical protein